MNLRAGCMAQTARNLWGNLKYSSICAAEEVCIMFQTKTFSSTIGSEQRPVPVLLEN